MKRLIVIVLLGLLAWQGYAKYEASRGSGPQPQSAYTPATPATASSQFKCDGRTHCSQMTSCAEATFFLKNCPGTKMDGNNDGVPCEQQWCK